MNSRSAPYLRTDEREEAIRSLEFAEAQARALAADPYLWKWVIVALHSAAQGFMVLALWNGNGLLAMRPRVAKKWLEAYERGGAFPNEKLDDFLALYAKVKDPLNFYTVGASAFMPAESSDESFLMLNEVRNTFTHFTPKGWSLQVAGLPRMCLDTLQLIRFVGWESTAILWHRRVHLVRAKRALGRLRRTLLALEVAHGV